VERMRSGWGRIGLLKFLGWVKAFHVRCGIFWSEYAYFDPEIFRIQTSRWVQYLDSTTFFPNELRFGRDMSSRRSDTTSYAPGPSVRAGRRGKRGNDMTPQPQHTAPRRIPSVQLYLYKPWHEDASCYPV